MLLQPEPNRALDRGTETLVHPEQGFAAVAVLLVTGLKRRALAAGVRHPTTDAFTVTGHGTREKGDLRTG